MTPVLRAAAATACILALGGCQKASDDAFGQRVHAYLMAHPEVVREAATKLADNERVAAAKAATASLGKYRAQLERDPRDYVVNPTGRITVVEFFDYRCGYCKLAAPEVVKIMADNPDIRFVFKEFPIFGEVSDTAAKIALTPQGKTKGLDLYKGWMSERALDEAGLDRHLAEVGLDPKAVRLAANTPEIQRQLLDTRALATALNIEGTPAFIVGDTMIPGADIDALKDAIAAAKRKGAGPVKS